MRSMRRGIKEMDLILVRFCDAELEAMDPAALDAYERLLEENDQQIYAWITRVDPVPETHAGLIARIRAGLDADPIR
ncbi:succinate dehydrogenase assembly factor 2 [Roseisalinus antarcticus]|nr:succinate dehydrogenase assembly factor 2 [Roseisalinus antarcticus]